MTVIEQQHEIERILRDQGLEWAVDMFAPSAEAPAFYLRALSRLEEYARHERRTAESFSVEWIRRLIAVSPHKAQAFLQALVSIRSTPILFAAWRILQGSDVLRLEMRYTRLEDFSLTVELQSPYGVTECYESREIGDAVFLRHLGHAKADKRPLFDGFFALRQT